MCILVRVFSVVILGASLAPVATWRSHAQPAPGHEIHHDWYKSLVHPRLKVPCCNSGDCRPVRHRIVEEGVEMWVGERWLPIPDVRVFEETTPDDGAHWCGEGEGYKFPATYCAIIPRRRS